MIVITGASKGIGKYLFQKFYDSGEDILGTYHSTLPDESLNDYFTELDISKYDDVRNWFENIKPKLNNIVLLNCAGANYNSFAHKSDIEQWANVINVNLIGTFNVIRALIPIMREQNFGRIINFSSVVAQIGAPGTTAYAASKSGLWGLTKSLALENASKGITINNLNLGYFDIGMIKETPEAYQAIVKSKLPTGSFGTPENIFNAINFIRASDYLNGTSLDINGCLY